MGTNFYLKQNYCKCCERYDLIHIGKSSAGWAFSLRVYDDIDSLDQWIEKFNDPDNEIIDEYGTPILPQEMISFITQRHGVGRAAKEKDAEWFSRNQCMFDPEFEIVRHTIDGDFCIGHGDGTYDLIRREFS